ncbi:MAG: ABC transporter permease subunit [Actinobacteria bacterium]|nr:ABC transporter permease subunit [Actinomycetota bacterium]MBI3688592.1 ABC transporter permease subunit [Actinomycetota bacterium]
MTVETVDVASGAGSSGPGLPPVEARHRRRLDPSWLALLPFVGYVLLFFVLPTAAVFWQAFLVTDPVTQASHASLANLTSAATGVYRQGFITSIELAAVSAVVGAVVGTIVAHIVLSMAGGAVRQFVLTASAVFANFGGVPLAFAFIATIGNSGILTQLLSGAFGIDLREDLHLSLYSFAGLVLVYLYFQVPLMMLVIAPALDGMRRQWHEAAASLGASVWQYWRHVAGPALAPSFVAALLLLFANGFAAFATAAALIGGSFPLVTLQIRDVLSGNVLAGQENVGAALGVGMVVVTLVVVAAYAPLQRRAARWSA